jgi:uncharacterized membrane protein YuzA (DUF378 family)
MWFFDFTSLSLIIAAGLQLGLVGFFGWDAAGAILGSYAKATYMIVGASALWQLSRQKFL